MTFLKKKRSTLVYWSWESVDRWSRYIENRTVT